MALDYASIMQAGQNLVPDFNQQLAQRQQMDLQKAQMDAYRAKAQQDQQALMRQEQFRAKLAQATSTNDPRVIGQLMMEYPEFADGIKPAYDNLTTEAKQRNLTQLGSAFQLGQSGDFKGAVGILQKRYDADLAAGQADETTKELLDALNSGDPEQQRRAVSVLGMTVAASDPAKFNETYKALNPAEKTSATLTEYDQRVAKFGKAAADKWLAIEDDKFIPVEGRGVYRASDFVGAAPPNTEGGDPAVVGGVNIPASGAAIEQTALAAVPGLTVTSRQRSPAKNASVGGKPNSFHLSDQARDFVPPKGMSMGALAAQLKQAMPGFDVINEGDHVHVEPAGGRAAGGPALVTKTVSGKTYYQINGRWFDNPEGR